jgi:hypothetical protein
MRRGFFVSGEDAKMRISFVVALLMGSTVFAQWTEPVPMVPQFGVGIVSPWISNDGLRLYLCSMAQVNVTSRDSIGSPWGPLVLLPSHINASPMQNSACESPSGDTLYFTSDSDQRPEGGYGWLDVYYSVRTDTGWGQATNCGPNINGPGREWSVGISRDGSTLLLSSGGPQGGYPDLYYCTKQVDGTWGIPVDFGQNINDMYDEEGPCLSPDNNRLFFSSDGENMGDIYESRRINGQWQPRTALPAPVNTHFGTEMSPCLAADGKTLWFRAAPWHGTYMIYTSEDTTVLSSGEGTLRPLSVIPRKDFFVMGDGSGNLKLVLPGNWPNANDKVCMYNLLGQKLFESVVSFYPSMLGSESRVKTGDLPTGTYVVTVRVGGAIRAAKFVIVK